MKKQKITFEKVISAGLGIYMLFVSLLIVRRAIDLWPFVFFIIVTLFPIYALYKIFYKNYDEKILPITLAAEAILATFLLFPAPLALLADFIGIECSNWSGVAEKCIDNTSFLSFDASMFILMVSMLLLAIFAYQKAK